jgi:hypothetical protein
VIQDLGYSRSQNGIKCHEFENANEVLGRVCSGKVEKAFRILAVYLASPTGCGCRVCPGHDLGIPLDLRREYRGGLFDCDDSNSGKMLAKRSRLLEIGW